MPTSAAAYPILDPASPIDPSTAALRATQCALVIMAKAPRPGNVKTRLSPPLSIDQAAAVNICFLKDTAESLQLCIPAKVTQNATLNGHPAAESSATGVVSYTPAGDEALFEGLLPAGFSLIPQRGENFGERLLFTAQDILACGYRSVCLIDSDSPTVPVSVYQQAVEALQAPGDCKERVILGPSVDGGYYLIGLTHPHHEPFSSINWSTSTVAAETRDRCHSAGLELIELPLWYDVDDAEAIALLTAELLRNQTPPFTEAIGYAAPHTRAFLYQLQQQGSLKL
jgi:rSAM/selenodomain-associated transferase 1